MVVNVKKFSEFSDANLADSGNVLVGISDGTNSKSAKVTTWTTATRPTPPYNGLLGYNTDTSEYEYWDSSTSQWIHMGTEGDSIQEITATSFNIIPNVIYIINNPSLVTGTLPITYPLGSYNEFVGKGAGGWKIEQRTGQSINVSPYTTTVGTSGYISSAEQFCCVKIRNILADFTFNVISSQGSFFVN